MDSVKPQKELTNKENSLQDDNEIHKYDFHMTMTWSVSIGMSPNKQYRNESK